LPLLPGSPLRLRSLVLVASTVLASGCGSVLVTEVEPEVESVVDAGPPIDTARPIVVTSLALAGYRACALTSVGAVKCWGANVAGGTSTAVEVDGLASGVRAIAVGQNVACAVTEAHTARCWGPNDHGQLGNGSNATSLVPLEVTGLGPVKMIAAGFYHACAITSAGAVKCWGANSHGALGNQTTTDSAVPVSVVGLSAGVQAIVAGNDHTCALTSAGAVKCWGDNASGQLGNNSGAAASVPVDVVGLSAGVSALYGGMNSTCAVTPGARLRCWGNGDHGMLGTGVAIDRAVIPVEPTALPPGITDLGFGWFHGCGRTPSGGALCWGANSHGQLGDGTTRDRTEPALVQGLESGVSSIAVGQDFSCATLLSGAAACWGRNESSQLGDGTGVDRATPVIVQGLP